MLGLAIRDCYIPAHVQTILQISVVFINYESRESNEDGMETEVRTPLLFGRGRDRKLSTATALLQIIVKACDALPAGVSLSSHQAPTLVHPRFSCERHWSVRGCHCEKAAPPVSALAVCTACCIAHSVQPNPVGASFAASRRASCPQRLASRE